jgi:predicted Zn-dependent protease
VLGPQAVITLVATLGQMALGSAGAFVGRSGNQVLSPMVDLVDDGCDPAGLPTSFDCAGAPKQRVALIERGVLRGVVSNATGHAVPPAWRFGADPLPSHLVLAPGSASDTDLLAECDTGLYIQRVDYVRVVHGRQTLVTGTPRDAILWIENGRIVARAPQFRFTVRLTDLFSLASLVALGARSEVGETPFMESIVAPAAVVAAFPVD